jgi:hypothetical protein
MSILRSRAKLNEGLEEVCPLARDVVRRDLLILGFLRVVRLVVRDLLPLREVVEDFLFVTEEPPQSAIIA